MRFLVLISARCARAMCLALAIMFAAGTSHALADDATEMKSILETKAGSIVALKTVIQVRISGRGTDGEQESESEVAGVMVSPDGLVVCSNMMLNGPVGMIRRMLGNRMQGVTITSDVQSVKVVLGPDDEEIDAKILARDEDLDLAWVQIEQSERTFEAVDLAKGVEADLGARLIGVRRMGKLFDRTPVTALATVVGQTERPRRLLVPQEELLSMVGLPVFSRVGEFVGIVITQLPEPGEGGAGGSPASALGNMASLQEGMTGLILPAADVLRATERARAGEGEKPADEAASQ